MESLSRKLPAFYATGSLQRLWKSRAELRYMPGGHLTPGLSALYTEILP